MKKLLAWHFVRQDRTLSNGSGLLAEPGYVYGEPEGGLKLCEFGMHWSRNPFDALKYAPGPWLCRVRAWGDVQEQDDKGVSRYREVLEMRDISRELRLFACWCVRETPIGEGRKVWDLLTDERSRNAVEVTERRIRGETMEEELNAAESAAESAARSAAESAQRFEFNRRIAGIWRSL